MLQLVGASVRVLRCITRIALTAGQSAGRPFEIDHHQPSRDAVGRADGAGAGAKGKGAPGGADCLPQGN